MNASPIRIIVCGGRDYRNAKRVCDVLDALHAETPIAMLWHGGALGADWHGRQWAATKYGVKAFAVPAQWSKHGKAAGPKRNQAMLGNLTPGRDLVIAFPGGRGTADMVKRARLAGVEVREITDQPPSPKEVV